MSGYSGMHAWLIQRLSGIYIALFAVVVFVLLLTQSIDNYQDWTALFSTIWMRLACSLFFLALLFHAWIGLRDVVIDYIHSVGIKILVLTLILLMLTGSGLLLIRALMMV